MRHEELVTQEERRSCLRSDMQADMQAGRQAGWTALARSLLPRALDSRSCSFPLNRLLYQAEDRSADWHREQDHRLLHTHTDRISLFACGARHVHDPRDYRHPDARLLTNTHRTVHTNSA